jgi:hypothetical protein
MRQVSAPGFADIRMQAVRIRICDRERCVADLERAIAGTAAAIFYNQGQCCTTESRLFDHNRSRMIRPEPRRVPIKRRHEIGICAVSGACSAAIKFCSAARSSATPNSCNSGDESAAGHRRTHVPDVRHNGCKQPHHDPFHARYHAFS